MRSSIGEDHLLTEPVGIRTGWTRGRLARVPSDLPGSSQPEELDRTTITPSRHHPPGLLASVLRSVGVVTLAAASLVGLPGVALAQQVPPEASAVVVVMEQPQRSSLIDELVILAAAVRPGTSSVADSGISPESATAWRSFGHSPRDGRWFDRHGNWADTQTFVTADQYAAMPAPQQRAFRSQVRAADHELKKGDAGRAIQRAAAARPVAGEGLDGGRSLRVEEDGTRTFGHRRIAGQFFVNGRWRDTGTLVSADQASAMSEKQRIELAESAGLAVPELVEGEATRVVVEVDHRFDQPHLEELARVQPHARVTHAGRRMTAATGAAFARLEGMLRERFPGREIRVTSTVEGQHLAASHKQGRAVDFVVTPLTRAESTEVERLCWKAGFRPFNEYVRSSLYKTGDHMHVELAL
ncbi:MAG: hypothetical protein AB1758_01975 [Candidatus Eremiobacterota bacterium]